MSLVDLTPNESLELWRRVLVANVRGNGRWC
jgi:hypothetical protein